MNKHIQAAMRTFARAGISAYVENMRTGLIVVVPRWSIRLRYHVGTGRVDGFPRVKGIDRLVTLAKLLQ